MKAIVNTDVGGPEVLKMSTADMPKLAASEVLVKVHATALNRADTLQRKGLYPAPPGASTILGLEMAGEVFETGSDTTKWNKGDRVCALLSGGGYAEYASVDEKLLLPISDKLTYVEAAAIPEVFLTAHQALNWIAQLENEEKLLIHAGASGVGTAAIQLAKLKDAEVIVTASKGKHSLCKNLGADHCIDYKGQDFAAEVADITGGKGVDVILDFLLASYFQKNLQSLDFDGRMVILAAMGGIKISEANIGSIVWKRQKVMGSTLRARDLDYKRKLIASFQQDYWPLFKDGQLKPIIYKTMHWSEVQTAHSMMDRNENAGKIVLEVD